MIQIKEGQNEKYLIANLSSYVMEENQNPVSYLKQFHFQRMNLGHQQLKLNQKVDKERIHENFNYSH